MLRMQAQNAGPGRLAGIAEKAMDQFIDSLMNEMTLEEMIG